MTQKLHHRNTERSSTLFLRLSVTLLCFCGLGCSAEYAGERLFWKAERIKAQLPADPKQATPQQVAAVVDAYQRVVRGVSGTEWAVKANSASQG